MNDIDLLEVEELYSLIVQLKTLRTMGGLKLESNLLALDLEGVVKGDAESDSWAAIF